MNSALLGTWKTFRSSTEELHQFLIRGSWYIGATQLTRWNSCMNGQHDAKCLYNRHLLHKINIPGTRLWNYVKVTCVLQSVSGPSTVCRTWCLSLCWWHSPMSNSCLFNSTGLVHSYCVISARSWVFNEALNKLSAGGCERDFNPVN